MEEQPQKSYHHGNLRQELLDTAEAQLSESGADELSLRALARAVGVSQTAPYRHFSDKNELLAALATRGYHKLLASLQAAAEAADDHPRAQLRAFAHSYVNYAAAHRDIFKLMFGPTLQPLEKYPDLREASRDTYDLVRTIMRAGIERAVFRDEDVAYLANAGWSAIHGIATLAIDTPELFERHVDLPRQVDLGVEIFLRGMAP